MLNKHHVGQTSACLSKTFINENCLGQAVKTVPHILVANYFINRHLANTQYNEFQSLKFQLLFDQMFTKHHVDRISASLSKSFYNSDLIRLDRKDISTSFSGKTRLIDIYLANTEFNEFQSFIGKLLFDQMLTQHHVGQTSASLSKSFYNSDLIRLDREDSFPSFG